jgi:hypothetical protein
LTHRLLGKDAHSLFRLAYSVLTAEPKATELLREHFFVLPILRTDQPIFAANREVSVMLRLAQFKLSNCGVRSTASSTTPAFRPRCVPS